MASTIPRTLFERAVHQSGDSVIISDKDGNIVYVNPAFEATTGYSKEEALGQSPRLLKSGMHEPGFYQELWRTISAGKVFRAVFINRRKNGQLYYEERTIAPVFGADGKIENFIATGRDVTAQRQAQEATKRLNEELERRVAERTAQLRGANHELEDFAYSIAHDLRAPLRHIGSFAGLLQERQDAETAPYLQKIHAAVGRMSAMIDGLLAYARKGRMELSRAPVDTVALVRDVVAELDADKGRRQVHWKIGELPQVAADAALLRQAFVNLLSNALKFTRRRARAEIEIGSLQTAGGEVVLFVKDNGAGFDMRYSGKLFGVFQRLHSHEEFEGTGIGLANVRRVVERHGGRIWAEAAVDKGASFYLSLPPAG